MARGGPRQAARARIDLSRAMGTRLLGGLLFLAALITLAGGSGIAAEPQPSGAVVGHPRAGSRGITESVADIVARQKREDRRTGGRPRGIREKPEPGGRQRPLTLSGPAVPQSPLR